MPSATEQPDQLLRSVLERVERDRPTEIRFVSGMAPELICAAGPRFLKLGYLSTEVVQGLHQLCLTWGEQSGILSRGSARYRVNVPGIGRFRCEYRLKGTTASLTLRPYLPEEPELADATRPLKRTRTRRA